MNEEKIDDYLNLKGKEYSIMCIKMNSPNTFKKKDSETELFQIHLFDQVTERSVLIAVRKGEEIESKRVELEKLPYVHKDIEHSCIKLRTKKQKIFIYCTNSKSVNTDPFIFKKYIEKLYNSKIAKDDTFIALGFFNMAGIYWESKNGFTFRPIDYGSATKNKKDTYHFLKKMDELGLLQLCNIRNKQNNVLDLVYTNRSDICKLYPDKHSDEKVNSFWLEIELLNHKNVRKTNKLHTK